MELFAFGVFAGMIVTIIIMLGIVIVGDYKKDLDCDDDEIEESLDTLIMELGSLRDIIGLSRYEKSLINKAIVIIRKHAESIK